MDMQEREKGFQEIWKLFAETGRRFQESQTELDKRFGETDKRFKETDKKFDRYFGKVKELDRNWGKLVESLVKPSVAEQFRTGNEVFRSAGPVSGWKNFITAESWKLTFCSLTEMRSLPWKSKPLCRSAMWTNILKNI